MSGYAVADYGSIKFVNYPIIALRANKTYHLRYAVFPYRYDEMNTTQFGTKSVKDTIAAFASADLGTQMPNSSSSQQCPAISRRLSLGSRGAEVTNLQQFLISQNLLASDSATGFFGRLTQAAVQEWQASNGVVSSGTPSTTGFGAVGPKTRAALANC